MRCNWSHTASIAAVLVVVPFIYSMHGVHGWDFPGVTALEASGHPGHAQQTIAPADLELVRADGALVRLRADRARLWTPGPAEVRPNWVELSGNVVVDSPEGEIRAARLEYEPSTGVYTAYALSMWPTPTENGL